MSPSNHASSSLLTHFEALEDPRNPLSSKHPLLDIVALTICAIIAAQEETLTAQLKELVSSCAASGR